MLILYNKGIPKLGSCQICNECSNSVSLLLWWENEGFITSVRRKKFFNIFFTLIPLYLSRNIDDQDKIHSKTALPPIPEPQEEPKLRKRNIHEPEKRKNSEWVAVESDNKEDIELDEKKNQKKIKKSRDPLHWFGLFVSPSLRTTQDHFKTGKKKKTI